MLLVIILTFTYLFPISNIHAYVPELNLKQAIQLSVKNSPYLRDVKTELVKKQIELQQAKEAIRDIRKKERTWEFSLLFKITPPEQHGLPKEIDLIMKIPDIQTKIQSHTKEKVYATLKAKYDAEVAYLDVIQSVKMVEEKQKEYNASKYTLNRIELQYKTGKGSKDDVAYMKNEVKNLEKELRQEVSNCDNKKGQVGKLNWNQC